MKYATGTIEPVTAKYPGALDGFEFRCGKCDEIARFSTLLHTQDHAKGHWSWMHRWSKSTTS